MKKIIGIVLFLSVSLLAVESIDTNKSISSLLDYKDWLYVLVQNGDIDYSMYVYNKKDTDTIEIGFPTVYNWIASTSIEDKASFDILVSAQVALEKLLTKLVNK